MLVVIVAKAVCVVALITVYPDNHVRLRLAPPGVEGHTAASDWLSLVTCIHPTNSQ